MELCELGKAEREAWWKAIDTAEDWWAEFSRPWKDISYCEQCCEALGLGSALRLEVAAEVARDAERLGIQESGKP